MVLPSSSRFSWIKKFFLVVFIFYQIKLGLQRQFLIRSQSANKIMTTRSFKVNKIRKIFGLLSALAVAGVITLIPHSQQSAMKGPL
ncbi:hypothetical protein EGR_07803 [Echinococcus granulosus]|uniref:Uncharacterized protein n=1 Tax=Echinococcus granulosus TaxID=6210 RepID=W6UV81_ECHGR|nr:hypothetical protein EGR_07803 [Echinococcus granulosus]EUB57344.1 hypothetical protein EGR_07803 [Echinococcus granulosus]